MERGLLRGLSQHGPSVSFTQVGAGITACSSAASRRLPVATGVRTRARLDDRPLPRRRATDIRAISFDPLGLRRRAGEVLRGRRERCTDPARWWCRADPAQTGRSWIHDRVVEGSLGDVAHGGAQYRTDGVFNAPLIPTCSGVRAVVDYRRTAALSTTSAEGLPGETGATG